MSAATLNDFATFESKKDNQEINAERDRILNTVLKKVQDQTLTLQETTDLYEKFNSTYNDLYKSSKPQDIDESWALELLQECEKDEQITVEEPPVLTTRINGIPHATKTQSNKSNRKPQKPANDSDLMSKAASFDNGISSSAKSVQADISEHFSTPQTSKQHHVFATFIVTSSIVTVAILLGFSAFF